MWRWLPVVFVGWLLGVLAIGLVVATSTHTSQQRITDSDDRAVSIATMACSNSIQSTSSGVVIDDGLVLTVAHAIFESRDFALRDARGRWHEGQVRYMDLERDLALVDVPTISATPVLTAKRGAGDSIQLLDGAVSGSVDGEIIRRVRIRTEVVGDLSQESVRAGYELGLEIGRGDSGAGVVDDQGTLVGVVFARSTSRESVTWATATSELDAIRDERGAPSWECGPGTGAELLLEDPEPPRLP